MGCAYYSAPAWMGLSNYFRYQESRGERLSWNLTLPWIWSLQGGSPDWGRGSFRVGGGLRLASDMNLVMEAWVPFRQAGASPLLAADVLGRSTFFWRWGQGRHLVSHALSWTRALPGLVADDGGEPPLPDRFSYAQRFDLGMGESTGLWLVAGWDADLDRNSWQHVGGGFSWRPDKDWRLSVGGNAAVGARDSRLYDYRLTLRITRDFQAPVAEGSETETGQSTPVDD